MATEFEQKQLQLLKEIKALLSNIGGSINGNTATSQVSGGSSSEMDKTSKFMASMLKHNKEMSALKKQILEQEKRELLFAEKMKKLEESRKKQAELIKDLNAIEAKQNKINGVKKKELAKLTKEELKNEQKNLDLLKKETKELKKQIDTQEDLTDEKKRLGELEEKEVKRNKTNLNITEKITNLLKKVGKDIYVQTLKENNAIAKLSSNYALNLENSKKYLHGLTDIGAKTSLIGVTMEDLAKMQGDYTDELGRSVLMTENGLYALAEMSKATGLSAENAASLVAEFETFGISVETSSNLMSKNMNNAKKQGVSASVAARKMSDNLKIANSYTFKKGLKGVSDMTIYSEKLKINMSTIAGLADKVSNPEGAIQTAASLQVLGGAFSQMADPMMLLNQGINDMEGLTKTYSNMLDNVATINKQTGELTIGGYDRLRMKAAAESMGVSFDEMMNTARIKAKRTAIEQTLNMTPVLSGQSNEIKDMIASIAQFTEGKGFGVNIGGEQKLLTELTAEDLSYLKPDEVTAKEVAKATFGIEDTLKNFYQSFKTVFSGSLIEVAQNLNKGLNFGISGYEKGIEGLRAKANVKESIGIEKIIGKTPETAKDLLIPSNGNPIFLDKKDDVFAAKPGGAIIQALTPNNNVQRGFSNTFNDQNGSSKIHGGLNLNINGTIKLTSDGSNPTTFNINELLKNQQFVKELTKIISNQMSRDENGGKYPGQLGRNSI